MSINDVYAESPVPTNPGPSPDPAPDHHLPDAPEQPAPLPSPEQEMPTLRSDR